MTQPVGLPLDRVDGIAKVTGGARYAADRTLPGMLHGALVLSTIARGTITSMDVSAAAAAPGVVAVFNHENAPRLVPGRTPLPMQDATINTNGQIIGYVVAQTLEQAQDAASMVSVTYGSQQAPVTFINDARDQIYLPGNNSELIVGDPQAGLAQADVTLTGHYTTPSHHHNAIEPHAIVVSWESDRFTAHVTTQGISGSRNTLATAVGVPTANGRVVCEYLGAGSVARHLSPRQPSRSFTVAISRPLKLVLTRAQTYAVLGQRAEFEADVTLGPNGTAR